MLLKKFFICIFSSLIIMFLANNSSYTQGIADNLADGEKSMENSTSSAVNVEHPKINEEDNIVPILELKGSVKQQEDPSQTPLRSWLNSDYAAGDWGGLRSKLEENGVKVEAVYTSEPFINLRGDVSAEYFGNLDLTLELETEKMHLWPGGKFFVYFQQNHGQGITNRHVGDLQTLSNIDPGESFTHLSEYWYEHSLFNEKLRIKLGKQDANEDFCSLDFAGDHIQSSFGLIPNVPIPTFPDPGLGVSTFIEPIDFISLGVGIFDGAAQGGTSGFDTTFDGQDGAVTIAEISLNPAFGSEKQYPGKYKAGFWHHSGDLEMISEKNLTRNFSGNAGFYLGSEQLIYKEQKSINNDQGLAVFAQYGWAPQDRNEISNYYGCGLTYKGLISKRDNDVAGFGAAFARLSKRLKDTKNTTGETALELFYKIQLTPWLAIQPDIQYIYNPSGKERDAVAFGVRSVISF